MQKISVRASIMAVVVLAACSDVSTEPTAVSNTAVPLSTTSRGALIAHATCATCHGPDFSGQQSDRITCPSLTVLAQYSFQQFDLLLSTGVTKDHGLANPMNQVGQELTPLDRLAVYDYLTKHEN